MGYTGDDIKQAIHEASPGLTDRKKDRFEYGHHEHSRVNIR